MRFHLPGPRSIHWKVFISHLLVLIIPCSYLVWTARGTVERAYLHSTEEGLIDIATMAGGVYARAVEIGAANPQLIQFGLDSVIEGLRESKPIKASVFGAERPVFDLELIICDASGGIVYDSRGRKGKLRTPDIVAALTGRYGARWERSDGTVKLYSTVPVRLDGKIIGSVTAIKPTKRIVIFIWETLLRFAVPALAAFSLAALLAYVLSAYITRVVWQLASQAEAIAAGTPNVRLETWTRSELGMLARALEKMRAKLEGKAYVENMVTTLSHELKTPLAAIRGAAELLEDGANNDDRARRKFLSNIQTEVRRLDRIVGDLLRLSRLEAIRPVEEPVDLVPLTRELEENLRARVESAGMRLDWQIQTSEARARLAGEQWELLLNNLVDNAVRFSAPGGLVEIVLSAHEQTIRLQVRDHGAGIEAELLPKIFDRFFTTPSPRSGERGTGLGLAIVKSVVEGAGGRIEVQSQAGVGATFEVLLPMA